MKRLAGFAAAVGLLVLAAVGVSLVQRDAAAPSGRKEGERIEEVIPAAGEIRDLALSYEARIGELEKKVGETRDALRSLQEAVDEVARSVERPLPAPETGAPEPEPPPPSAPDRLLVVDLKPKTPGKGRRIPAGGFGEATLLTGVFAPVNGEALPVLLRLDAVVTGPQRTRVPVQGAFLIGKAEGDANASRATVQLVRLSTAQGDHEVNGYVVDDDGVQGLRGEYVWNAGRLAALAAGAGFSKGAAGVLARGRTRILSGPLGPIGETEQDPLRTAGAAGAASAFDEISRILEERIREFTPAVYVHNRRRRVTVVFLESVRIPGAPPEAPSDEPNLGAFDR